MLTFVVRAKESPSASSQRERNRFRHAPPKSHLTVRLRQATRQAGQVSAKRLTRGQPLPPPLGVDALVGPYANPSSNPHGLGCGQPYGSGCKERDHAFCIPLAYEP
ncbi:hypothetical protein L1887_56488 [Cichorium endivia]|nr:hypothetical protein L1887_56488 [Cichorium endivia]